MTIFITLAFLLEIALCYHRQIVSADNYSACDFAIFGHANGWTLGETLDFYNRYGMRE